MRFNFSKMRKSFDLCTLCFCLRALCLPSFKPSRAGLNLTSRWPETSDFHSPISALVPWPKFMTPSWTIGVGVHHQVNTDCICLAHLANNARSLLENLAHFLVANQSAVHYCSHIIIFVYTLYARYSTQYPWSKGTRFDSHSPGEKSNTPADDRIRRTNTNFNFVLLGLGYVCV